MNRFDAYITYYLYENKEVSLEKIGTLKAPASFAPGENQAGTIEFIYDRKVATSEGLINFIAEKAAKNKYLITSDLESHFAQVREFINIGKSYEIPDIGFIKANKSGVYEFLPYSDVNKPARNATTQQTKRSGNINRGAIQVITALIVIAILAGLGWEAYQYFSKPKSNTTIITNNNVDTTVNAAIVNTTNHADTEAVKQALTYSDSNIINAKYIFETTASLLRAQTRTAQLKGFGNNASYDSFTNNNTKFYSLYILKPTKVADTLRVRDSLAKFFQRDVQIKIAP